HRRLLAALEALRAEGAPASPPARADIERRHPALAPYLRLLDHCVSSYPDVLVGRKEPTQILFPAGSLALVEEIYRGNALTEYYNNLVADAVVDFVRGASRRVRILEIGGGTGGTTQAVLPAVAAAGVPVDYLFTDLSQGFLRGARERWEREYPFVRYQLFDVEQPSGVDEPVDVIVAANVLHATRDLRTSLRAAQRLLAPGGIVVLNEISRMQLFATLTFGLTPGWWRYEDERERLPHGPAASPESWLRLLEECGFRDARVLSAETGIQAVIVATAGDGVRRSTEPLEAIFAEVLKVPVEEIHAGEPFDRYGLESLTALQIIDRLETRYGTLPKTLLFEHNTISKLAAYLESNGAPAPAPVPAKTEIVDDDGIAIVGMAGRYPGAETLDDFWLLLRDGRSAVGPIPRDRWDVERYFDSRPGTPGRSYNRNGGFLADIRGFDAALFHISPREARSMDPQERLFLETVWHCLEDAGHSASSLDGRGGVGVFAGVMYNAYQWNATESWAEGGGSAAAGSAHWSVANRVSFFFDFHGPSLAVDTACSSSLAAIHLACQSLRDGDCRAAVAGGVNLITHPLHDIQLSEMTMLSASGECAPFAKGADGFVAGEGVGAVLLRPLADALRDGDRIYGVIRGTAMNAGGRTSGYTVPDPAAQAAVIERALERAGVAASDVSCIEAHGTGTNLGDPIELRGLQKAFATEARGFCALGSVKFNVGHCESAAGIAALTKVLLQLRHGTLVPGIGDRDLNPLLDLERSPFIIPRRAQAWTGRRIAGISSFGAGGANAHVVVEGMDRRPAARSEHGPRLIVASAKTPETLRRVLERLSDSITDDMPLADVAFTL
ncbi:MAG TPA: beta-ketoacyl synthase N-terminal-like domain-containing protein, partial [Thermoanaerobaculia bacterium]